MASSIIVDFEVLPEEGPSDKPATQVCGDLRHQLRDPSSVLRNGEFGRFAARATLTAPGLPPEPAPSFPDEPADLAPPPPPPPLRGQPAEAVFGAGSAYPSGSGHFSTQSGGHWSQQAPGPYDTPAETSSRRYPGSEWQGAAGLSNAELVDRISQLERQLSRTAAGGRAPQDMPPTLRRGTAAEYEALEEKCTYLQQRLEAAERELREAQESSRAYRIKMDQLELKLKDREQLLVHAKEMWMKENVRASKLADALTSAEDKLADQERRLAEVGDRYNEAQQEVRQLRHLVGDPADGGAGFGDSFAVESRLGDGLSKTQRPPATTGHMSGVGPRSPSQFDTSFGLDSLAGHGRGSSLLDATVARPPPTSPGGLSSPDQTRYAPSDADTNADRFRRLCLLNDAVLYEDELLQVGIKAEYSGKEGQVAVYFGNKGNAALQAFTVQYFVREERALRLSASPLSQQLEADKQVVQRVNVACLEPFVEPPWLRVQFLLPDASPRRVQMKFPVTLTKFMLGRELSAQEFFRHWRQQHFVLNEVTNIVNLAERLRGALVHVARSIVFGGALRLLHGIDTNPDNFVLVSQLADQISTGHDRDGDRGLDVLGLGPDRDGGLSLIRVEVGTGRFTGKVRIVVRSSDHTVARALCDSITLQLCEANAPSTGGSAAR